MNNTGSGASTKRLYQTRNSSSSLKSSKTNFHIISNSMAITKNNVTDIGKNNITTALNAFIKTRNNSIPFIKCAKKTLCNNDGKIGNILISSQSGKSSLKSGDTKKNHNIINNNNSNLNNQNKPNRNDNKQNNNDNNVNSSENDDNHVQNATRKRAAKATNTTTKSTKRTKRTKRKYLCHFCNKVFLGGNDLRKHIRVHTDERPFECTHCGQKFRQGGCLKNHIASQHGTTQTFTCYYCNKTFPIKERLRLHMRLHSGEKPYQCKVCLRRFARGGQLTQHLATHNGIKKYHCTQCSASFSCSMNLKLHLKGHSNERDYTCHMCGKSFIRPDALKKHLTCFHENVRAFYCHICSRTFKGHLPQHMRTHENIKSHKCTSCNAIFSQKSQLIVHQRIHSGERPYRCQVCWQAFAHSSVLKLHIRKHTGEKPFKCTICKHVETAFSQLPHLKTHMRAIHGMDKAYNCEFCSEYFKIKHELQEHKIKCSKSTEPTESDAAQQNEQFDIQQAAKSKLNASTLSLSKMRLLVAVLLKKISSPIRLKELGFDKRLIDNVLIGALRIADQSVCEDASLTEAERLRTNVREFLEWSVPDAYMRKFKREQRSTEELLEELTSNFKPDLEPCRNGENL